jgi:hypothetical protein
MAQPTAESAASKDDILSFDQKLRIAAIITKRTPPLAGANFPSRSTALFRKKLTFSLYPLMPKRWRPSFVGSATSWSKN